MNFALHSGQSTSKMAHMRSALLSSQVPSAARNRVPFTSPAPFRGRHSVRVCSSAASVSPEQTRRDVLLTASAPCVYINQITPYPDNCVQLLCFGGIDLLSRDYNR